MEPADLDDIDRGILHMLQEDARNNTATDIADEVGVAPNTVRNRIEQLEEQGVIKGYAPQIDYERAGYQPHVLFVCTVPISDRETVGDKALEVEGVVGTIERLSGRDNLGIEVVARDSEDLTRIATELEEHDISLHEEWFIKNIRAQPFDQFGQEVIDE